MSADPAALIAEPCIRLLAVDTAPEAVDAEG